MSQDASMMLKFSIIATDVESVLAMQAHLLRDDNNDQVLRAVIVTRLVEARRSAAAFVLHENGRPAENEGPPVPSASPSRLPARHRRPLAAFDHRVLDVGVAGQTN